MTYNAGKQQWICNLCSATEQPQDIRNMIRHILWHKRKQQAEQESTKPEQQEPITYIQELRIKTHLLPSTETIMQEHRFHNNQ